MGVITGNKSGRGKLVKHLDRGDAVRIGEVAGMRKGMVLLQVRILPTALINQTI